MCRSISHEFAQRPNAKKGECHVCYKDRQRKHAAIRQAKGRRFLARIKKKFGCSKCGYKEHPAALEFDHIIPVSNANRPSMQYREIPSIKRYVRDPNIQLLCANCHRIKTFDDVNKHFKEIV